MVAAAYWWYNQSRKWWNQTLYGQGDLKMCFSWLELMQHRIKIYFKTQQLLEIDFFCSVLKRIIDGQIFYGKQRANKARASFVFWYWLAFIIIIFMGHLSTKTSWHLGMYPKIFIRSTYFDSIENWTVFHGGQWIWLWDQIKLSILAIYYAIKRL